MPHGVAPGRAELRFLGNVRNGAISPHLPVAWTVLYELTKLTDKQFANGIESRAINQEQPATHGNRNGGQRPS